MGGALRSYLLPGVREETFNMVWFPMLCLGAENFTHAIQDFFLISNQFKA